MPLDQLHKHVLNCTSEVGEEKDEEDEEEEVDHGRYHIICIAFANFYQAGAGPIVTLRFSCLSVCFVRALSGVWNLTKFGPTGSDTQACQKIVAMFANRGVAINGIVTIIAKIVAMLLKYMNMDMCPPCLGCTGVLQWVARFC